MLNRGKILRTIIQFAHFGLDELYVLISQEPDMICKTDLQLHVLDYLVLVLTQEPLC